MSHTVLNPEDEYMEPEVDVEKTVSTMNTLYARLEFDPEESLASNVYRISSRERILRERVARLERHMEINDKYIELQSWVLLGSILTVASFGVFLLKKC